MSCTIEEIEVSENQMPHDMLNRFFSKKNTAIAAVGSLACIRTLWFRSYWLGELHRFYGKAVSAAEYALGKQVVRLKECIQKASEAEGVRHIIVYASCLEVVSMCDLEMELQDMSLPEGVDVHIFYRGSLVKRTMKPAEVLEKLLTEIEAEDELTKIEIPKENALENPPPLPDFAKKMLELKEKDCDVLLVSPGGCKSCLRGSCAGVDVNAHFYATRFDDVSISLGCPELFDVILEFFDTKRPLFLVGSGVFHMIGFDGRELAARLTQAGRETVWLESDGI